MSGLVEVGQMMLESHFGQMIVQTGRVSAGTAFRLAGLSLIGIAISKTSDTATRMLNQAPWHIGTLSEYVNPTLIVSRVNKITDEACNKAAFWATRALKWHSVGNDKASEEAGLEHIENQRFKSNSEVKSGDNASVNGKDLLIGKLSETAVTRTLNISSIFQSVVAVTLAATGSLLALRFAEYASPGIDTWNKLAEALNIPVRALI